MTDLEIKKAYHLLAVKIHPDKPGGDTVKFQALQASYHEIAQSRGNSARSAHTNQSTSNENLRGMERAVAIQNDINRHVNAW